MQTTILTRNRWAITGGILAAGLDYDRDFYSHLEADNIDAPSCVPAGSTIKNEFAKDGETLVVPAVVWCRS